MPRRQLSAEQIEWLHQNHKTMKLTQCSRHLGFNADTLRRQLVRDGLRTYDGAKYAIGRRTSRKTWRRPCMACGDTTPRERNLYLCEPCRSQS